MSYYVLEPEVPGSLGERTELIHRAGTYPLVTRLHFEFSYGSLGDDLFTSHPAFMVTTELATALKRSGLSGFSLSSDVEVSVDEQVWRFEPDWHAPSIEWLQVTGVPALDDLGLTADARLVVSSAALAVLSGYRIGHCKVTPFSGITDAR